MLKNCPLCKNSRKKDIVIKDDITNKYHLATKWCVCTRVDFILSCNDYNLLQRLRNCDDEVLLNTQIDKKLKFYPYDLEKSPNLLIKTDDTQYFYNNIKAVILNYRFINNPPSFICMSSIEFLKRFYVQQSDGSSSSLSDVDKYSLVVISFDNKEKNDQLKTCMLQIIHNRIAIKKPTWIYIDKPSLDLCIWEYSEELKDYIDKYYEKIVLKDKSNIKDYQKINDSASNFKPKG